MKVTKAALATRLQEVEDQFVDLWRTMSSLWGISPTMAHIMDRLGISRGNVSMNLTKLVEWGLVRRVHKRRDRRDYYESLSDVWDMFTLVANQRKRREIDPIINTLRRCREELLAETRGRKGEDSAAGERLRRVNDLLAFFTLM